MDYSSPVSPGSVSVKQKELDVITGGCRVKEAIRGPGCREVSTYSMIESC